MSIPTPPPYTTGGKIIVYFQKHQFAAGLVAGFLVGQVLSFVLHF